MKLDWSGPQQVQQETQRPGEFRTIAAETTLEDRFVLYHAGGTMVPNMWGLHDRTAKSTHYLCGDGWDGAKAAAAERIHEILHPKLRKPRKRKPQ